ncbi:MAG: YraN family protein [Coxiella sp. RIFCSPHIGHO2_12_FULL_44_14]|nr:MAG: YraN family protein [Coxiella sp. RIFCSPHIGHO2_12_FULL_44_14]
MTSFADTTGGWAESYACEYLQKQGLSCVMKNFRCPQGEIDLIMQESQYFVFVEVRFRKHPRFGDGIETISYSKQRRLISTALQFLQQRDLIDKVNGRFDVLGITAEKNIVWIKNAFEVQY